MDSEALEIFFVISSLHDNIADDRPTRRLSCFYLFLHTFHLILQTPPRGDHQMCLASSRRFLGCSPTHQAFYGQGGVPQTQRHSKPQFVVCVDYVARIAQRGSKLVGFTSTTSMRFVVFFILVLILPNRQTRIPKTLIDTWMEKTLREHLDIYIRAIKREESIDFWTWFLDMWVRIHPETVTNPWEREFKASVFACYKVCIGYLLLDACN